MGLVVAPVKEGKLEAWKSWTSEFKSARKEEFDAFNKRQGLNRHEVWLAEIPNGPLAIVLHEGPGVDSFMQDLGHSDHSFDNLFAESIKEIHGMDVNAPPPGPLPVKMI